MSQIVRLLSDQVRGFRDDFRYLLESFGITFGNIDLKKFWYRVVFSRKKQAEFILDFSSFLKTGSAKNACESIIIGVEKSSDEKTKSLVAGSILNSLEEGGKVSDGMKGWFRPDIQQIYRAGEKANRIEDVLSIYSKQEEQVSAFKKSFLMGLKLPAQLFVIGTLGYIGMWKANWLGFPAIKPVNEWVEFSQYAYYISEFVSENIGYIALITTGLFWSVSMFSQKSVSPLRMAVENIFPFNIVKAMLALRFIKIMAVLKTAKLGDFEAVNIFQESTSNYGKYYTKKMKTNLNSGAKQLADTCDVDLLPPRLMSRLHAVSRASGDEARLKALYSAADYAEKEISLMLGKVKFYMNAVILIITAIYASLFLVGFALVQMSLTQN